MAISLISLGSNQTFFLPHRITEEASLFCNFRELQHKSICHQQCVKAQHERVSTKDEKSAVGSIQSPVSNWPGAALSGLHAKMRPSAGESRVRPTLVKCVGRGACCWHAVSSDATQIGRFARKSNAFRRVGTSPAFGDVNCGRSRPYSRKNAENGTQIRTSWSLADVNVVRSKMVTAGSDVTLQLPTPL